MWPYLEGGPLNMLLAEIQQGRTGVEWCWGTEQESPPEASRTHGWGFRKVAQSWGAICSLVDSPTGEFVARMGCWKVGSDQKRWVTGAVTWKSTFFSLALSFSLCFLAAMGCAAFLHQVLQPCHVSLGATWPWIETSKTWPKINISSFKMWASRILKETGQLTNTITKDKIDTLIFMSFYFPENTFVLMSTLSDN